MSIASEISRLQTAKADMKTALEAKGVTVGTAHLDTYDTLIASISSGVDISDADAVVADVVASKTFYATSGGKKTGTMVDRGTVSTDISAVATEVTIAAGKHSGSGIVKIAAAEQAKIIAGNIKDGITLLGVAGNVTSGGGTYSKVVRQLTSSGTWTKPTGLVFLEVVCIGGGGGGASGAKRAAGVASRGGGGGACGSIVWRTLLSAQLSSEESYVVGAGGGGGAAQTANSSANVAGSAGGDTSFGSLVLAIKGGGAGNSGSAGNGSAVDYQTPYSCLPSGSGGSSVANGIVPFDFTQNDSNLSASLYGGSAGGGITTANAHSAGGNAAYYKNKANTVQSNMTGGTAGGGNGNNGADNWFNRLPFILGTTGTPYADVTVASGTSGSGGGSNNAGNAGNGGNGGLYGGAGGGGGAARNDVGNSGRGGNGGQGVIILIEHIVA